MKMPPSSSCAYHNNRWWPRLAAGAIILSALVAYIPSFSGVFIYDDEPAILRNETIRNLWSFSQTLCPPADTTVSGRPVANLSFALNYALGGTQTWGYHAINLLIHILGGLVLFGIVRRTLALPTTAATDPHPQLRPAGQPTAFAFGVALLWTIHPLQTESVTYIVQRVESLMALFYLLTFYCFLRATQSARPRRWLSLSATACLLGMGTKEVTATAPVLLFLFDRTFVAGSFRHAWAQRRRFYLALAATWLPLAALVASTGWNRGGTVGFDVGTSPWAYWLTQFEAIPHYLGLSVWPHPLVFDYATHWTRSAGEIIPYALIVCALVVATVWALRRYPSAGFLGAWFLVILAPTSLVPSSVQMIVEHRMYLPLVAVIIAVMWAIWRMPVRTRLPLLLVLAAACACLTVQRNRDYQSEQGLWSDTLAKCPTNDRAHNNLGNTLARTGEIRAAMAHFETAIRLRPDAADTRYNLGNALRSLGRDEDAIVQYEQALQLNPAMPDAEVALGAALADSGRPAAAIAHYECALRMAPDYATAHNRLGIALARTDRPQESIAHFERALRTPTPQPDVHNNLGNALRATGRIQEAIAQYEQAIHLDPGLADAHSNLGRTYVMAGLLPESLQHFERALALSPNSPAIHDDLGMALAMSGRISEALAHFQEALRLAPDMAPAHLHMALVLENLGRHLEAQRHFEAARRLGLDLPE